MTVAEMYQSEVDAELASELFGYRVEKQMDHFRGSERIIGVECRSKIPSEFTAEEVVAALRERGINEKLDKEIRRLALQLLRESK